MIDEILCNGAGNVQDFQIFTWKIPSLSVYEKHLLCNGYVKNNCKKYITNAIIELFALYFTNDEYSLDEIKSAVPGQLFHSRSFH